MNGASALRLELRPSHRLAAAIVIAHLAAGAALYLVLPGVPGAALGVLLGALGVASAHDRALLRGRRAARYIHLQGDGRGSIESVDGVLRPLVPHACRGGRHWVILPLQRGRRRHLLVASGMLDPESFRRLRLWARWGRLPRTGPSGHAA